MNSSVIALLNRILGFILVFIILLLLCIWAFSPAAVRYYAPSVLEPLGYKLGDETSVRLNPFKAAVTISDLSLIHQSSEEPQASIELAEIDLSLWGLTQQKIGFDALKFEGLGLNVDNQDTQTSIAAYPITSAEEQQNEQEEASSQATELPNWSINIPSFDLERIEFFIHDKEQKHTIVFEELRGKDIDIRLDRQSGHAELSAILNEAKFDLEVQFELDQGVGNITFDTSLESFNAAPLSYLVTDYLGKLAGQAGFDIEGSIQLEEGSTRIALSDSRIETKSVTAWLPSVAIQDSSALLEAEEVFIQINQDSESEETNVFVEGKTALTLEQIRVLNPTSEDLLVGIELLEIPQQTFEASSDQSFSTEIPEIKLSALSFSQVRTLSNESEQSSQPSIQEQVKEPVVADIPSNPTKEGTIQSNETVPAPPANQPEQEALFKLDSLAAKQIKASDHALSIEHIELGEIASYVLVDEQQQIANLVSINKETNDPRTETETETNNAAESVEKNDLIEASNDRATSASTNNSENLTADQAPTEDLPSEENATFAFSLARLDLSTPGTVNFVYQAMEPPYRQTFSIDTLSLSKLNNTSPEHFSHLDIKVSSGAYTKASVEGDIAPFAEKANMNLDIVLQEFSLPKISPFIRTAAGFDMSSGQLDADTKVSIVEDEISGESVIQIRGLEIDNAGDVHNGSLAEKTFIPLNIALGALKDSDGRIDLSVPLKGNVNSPDFGLGGFLNLVAQRAAIAASQSYVINTFVPYANIVTLTSIAGSYALKPRLDDLIFEEGQLELSDEEKAFLDKVTQLLEDKSDTDMRVCSFASLAEEDDLENDMTLLQLALTRGENVKNYLVEENDIASTRIQLCQAKSDHREDALPRVEFEF